MIDDKDPQQPSPGGNNWLEYRLFVLESLKQANAISKELAIQMEELDKKLSAAIADLDVRVRNIENRMYMVMGGLSLAMFLFELYRTFAK